MLITLTNYLVNEGELLHSLWRTLQEINSLSELTTTRHFRCYWTISGITRTHHTIAVGQNSGGRTHVRWTQGAPWGKMQEWCAAGWSFSPGASSRCSFLRLLCSCLSLCEPGSACLTPTPACSLPACLPLGGNQIWRRNMKLFFCQVSLSSLVWSSGTIFFLKVWEHLLPVSSWNSITESCVKILLCHQ